MCCLWPFTAASLSACMCIPTCTCEGACIRVCVCVYVLPVRLTVSLPLSAWLLLQDLFKSHHVPVTLQLCSSSEGSAPHPPFILGRAQSQKTCHCAQCGGQQRGDVHGASRLIWVIQNSSASLLSFKAHKEKLRSHWAFFNSFPGEIKAPSGTIGPVKWQV